MRLYVYNDDGGGIIDSCSDGLLGYNKLCCCYEQTFLVWTVHCFGAHPISLIHAAIKCPLKLATLCMHMSEP